MTNTVYSTQFRLSEGKEVEIPSNIGRKQLKHERGSMSGNTTQATVVGDGELEPYVLLSVDVGAEEVPEGAEVLGIELVTSTLWFMVPKSAYGGGGS